jgi:hypothetical protein
LAAAGVALVQGCVFSTARLDIATRPNANFKGPLSQVAPIKFDIKPLEDKRSDEARIGWKKNGYGKNTADILSYKH